MSEFHYWDGELKVHTPHKGRPITLYGFDLVLFKIDGKFWVCEKITGCSIGIRGENNSAIHVNRKEAIKIAKKILGNITHYFFKKSIRIRLKEQKKLMIENKKEEILF